MGSIGEESSSPTNPRCRLVMQDLFASIARLADGTLELMWLQTQSRGTLALSSEVVSRDGAGMLQRIDGTLRTHQYIHILEHVFYPLPVSVIQMDHYCSCRIITQLTNRWMFRDGCQARDRRDCSACRFTRFENAWARLKGRTRELIADRPPRNHDELWDHVLDAWEKNCPGCRLFLGACRFHA